MSAARSCLAALALTGAVLAALPAGAAPVVYTSRAAFLTALSVVPTVQDYESIDPGLYGTEVSTGTPIFTYTLGGVTVTSSAEVFADFDYVASNTQLRSAFSAAATEAARVLTLTLGSGVNALGLDLIDYQSDDTLGSDPLTITAFGLATVVDGTPGPGSPDFFGIIDTAATTTTLSVSRTAEVFYPLSFDNVTYAALAVPEPASMAMFGLGIAVLAARRRR